MIKDDPVDTIYTSERFNNDFESEVAYLKVQTEVFWNSEKEAIIPIVENINKNVNQISICDIGCMNAPCNYDVSLSLEISILNSDCQNNCRYKGIYIFSDIKRERFYMKQCGKVERDKLEDIEPSKYHAKIILKEEIY